MVMVLEPMPMSRCPEASRVRKASQEGGYPAQRDTGITLHSFEWQTLFSGATRATWTAELLGWLEN